jgi:hypothetical protein
VRHYGRNELMLWVREDETPEGAADEAGP